MQYLVKYSFSTAKVGKRGAVKGNWGNAETKITTDADLETLQKEMILEVKSACYRSLKELPKIANTGNIIDINITCIALTTLV